MHCVRRMRNLTQKWNSEKNSQHFSAIFSNNSLEIFKYFAQALMMNESIVLGGNSGVGTSLGYLYVSIFFSLVYW